MDSLAYLRILVHTAYVDGKLQNEERALLRGFAKRLKLSSQQFQQVMEDRGQSVSARDFPSDPKQAQTLFRHMARTVAADAILHPREERLMKNVGKRLGLGEATVNSVIDRELSAARPINNNHSYLQPDANDNDSHKETGKSKLTDAQMASLQGIALKLRILGIFSVLGTLAAGLGSLIWLATIGYTGMPGLVRALCLVVMTCLLIGLAIRQYGAAGEFSKSATPGFGHGPILTAIEKLDALFMLQILLAIVSILSAVLPRAFSAR